MYDVMNCKKIFYQYCGMMRTQQMSAEKISYWRHQQLINDGYIEKIRTGYYQWVNPEDVSWAGQ